MNIKSNLILNFGNLTNDYYDLLKEEDFNFKTKDIKIDFVKVDDNIEVDLNVSSILDLKIASNALIKSLEIIDKTMNI